MSYWWEVLYGVVKIWDRYIFIPVCLYPLESVWITLEGKGNDQEGPYLITMPSTDYFRAINSKKLLGMNGNSYVLKPLKSIILFI